MLRKSRGLMKFLKNSKFQIYPCSFSKVLLSSSLFSLFPPFTKTHHSSPPKESFRNKFSNIQIGIHVQKNRNKWSKFTPLKKRGRKEAKEDPNLMANGRFHVWLLLEGEGETSFSPPSIFHPMRFYLNLFFPLILGFCFTMVLNHYYVFFLNFH